MSRPDDDGGGTAETTTPPTHDGLPLLGNTIQLVRQQGDLFEAAADRGGVVELSIIGMGDLYLVTEPALVEEILNDRERFSKASQSQEHLGHLLGEGLVLSEGDLWERQRDLIQPMFYMDRITEYADTMVDRSRGLADDWAAAGVVDVEDEMKGLTLQILVESIFGSDIDYEERGIRETVDQMQEPGKPMKQPIARLVPKWVPIPMWRRYRAGIAKMESVIEDVVEQRRGEDGDDLVSLLLAATDDDGESMSEKQLRDELMTFLFAGHETTATALTFAWLLLAKNPTAERRLLAELDGVLGDEPPTFENVPDLKYTTAVLRESMRLYPPVPQIPRETDEPVELGEYSIPEGATIAPSQWAIHRDDQYWDDPEQFRPARFLGDDDRPLFSFFPFGGGPRKCIGQQFALVEGKLVLATLARRHHLELVSDPDPDVAVTVTTRPIDPIEMRVEPRGDGG